MIIRSYIFPNVDYVALGINEKGATDGAHVGFAEEFFGLPGAKGFH